VRRENAALRMTLPEAPGAKVQVHCGSLAPISGWVSRAFDHRAPSPTLAWSARLSGRTTLRTEIIVYRA
jgi:hypothetical protein